MRHGGGVLFSTVVAITLAGGTAYAGCPNLCDLTVEPAAMEPPLPCAAVNVRADECDCAAGVSLLNTCTTALEALDFSFDACSPEGDLTSVELQCTLVQPRFGAVYDLKPTELGHKEWELHLRNDGNDHTLTVTAHVKSFKNGACTCAVAGAAGSAARGLGFGAIALLFGLGARRARRGFTQEQ
jgi:hypothetical protein